MQMEKKEMFLHKHLNNLSNTGYNFKKDIEQIFFVLYKVFINTLKELFEELINSHVLVYYSFSLIKSDIVTL